MPLPRYNTDIEDAHCVVATMKEKGFTLSLKHEMQNGSDHYVALFGKMDRRTYLYIQTDTMPLAICIATLWAVQGSNVKA